MVEPLLGCDFEFPTILISSCSTKVIEIENLTFLSNQELSVIDFLIFIKGQHTPTL